MIQRGWDIPGGRIENGETAIAAAVRELREETGVLVEKSELEHIGFFTLEVKANKPEGYIYPYPLTHQPVYFLEVPDSTDLFSRVPEEIEDVKVFDFDWVEENFKDRSTAVLLAMVKEKIMNYGRH